MLRKRFWAGNRSAPTVPLGRPPFFKPRVFLEGVGLYTRRRRLGDGCTRCGARLWEGSRSSPQPRGCRRLLRAARRGSGDGRTARETSPRASPAAPRSHRHARSPSPARSARRQRDAARMEGGCRCRAPRGFGGGRGGRGGFAQTPPPLRAPARAVPAGCTGSASSPGEPHARSPLPQPHVTPGTNRGPAGPPC